ncbi:hypothetical protein LNO75_00610 [Mycoplasma sp. T363T]|uniref:MG321/MPN456 family lipoprotein n=1 Tax=Mycoplasma bradburyae TaxID=2963128 RepID=UPI00234101F0|nr:MG321/MPN456 family lipoprotein [Mycoplasma bradburyae]MDC4163083.1 hypothetical protein [Mycoplasma bradburyae]
MKNNKLLKKTRRFLTISGLLCATIVSSCARNSQVDSPYIDKNKSFVIKDASGLRDIQVNYDTWLKALDSYGATSTKPFIANYKSLDVGFSLSQSDYWNNLKNAIENLSNNKIKFNFNNPQSARISIPDWNPNGNSTLGSLRWSTTYQHIAPYLEVYFWTQYFNNSIKPLYDFLVLITKKTDEYINKKGEYFVVVANNLKEYLLSNKVFKNFTDSFEQSKQDNNALFSFDNNNFSLILTDWQFGSTDEVPSEERSKFLIDFLDSRLLFLPTHSLGREEFNRILIKPGWGYIDSIQYRDIVAPDDNSILRTAIKFNPFINDGRWAPLNEQLFTVSEFGFDTTLSGLTTIQYEDVATKATDAKQIVTLELAKKIKLYDKENNLLSVILRKDQDKNALSEEEKAVLYDSYNIDISEPKLNAAVFKATRYEFDIDTNFKWKNYKGEDQWSLSAKDWERGMEIYHLSNKLGINPNGNYLNQANVDLTKTISHPDVEVNSNDYDIGDFTQTQDDKLNIYLTKPYFNLLIFISNNGAFRPRPHLADSVKNLRLSTQKDKDNSTLGKIVLNSDNQVDTNRSDIANIFGGYSNKNNNANQALLNNAYYIGPYYLNSISDNDIVFKKNENYFNILQNTLTNKKVPKTIVQQYGATDLVALVQSFNRADGLSFLDINSLRSNTIHTVDTFKYLKNLKVSKVKRINHTVWSNKPYVNNAAKSNIGEVAARFLDDFDSDNARIFRAGLIAFIKWRDLAKLIQQGANFYYSVAPYGIFNYKGTEWYESISKNERMGGLVLPLSEYGYNYKP